VALGECEGGEGDENDMRMTMAVKDLMSDPEMCSQELKCWQMANQLARTLPLCARYKMVAAVEAPAVNRARCVLLVYEDQAPHSTNVAGQIG
jgi:hypothetical protein